MYVLLAKKTVGQISFKVRLTGPPLEQISDFRESSTGRAENLRVHTENTTEVYYEK